MTDSATPEVPAGWELLFQNGSFPPRFQTMAAPNESVVEWAETLPAGGSVLDIGCGIGRHTVYLGKRGFKMAGMDLSPTGIKTTQEVCTENNIDFDGRVADLAALPWTANTFDGALATSVMSHNRRADILKTMEEVKRVLKPGGLFVVDFLHKATLAYQRVRDQVAAGTISEVEPDTFVDENLELNSNDDAFLPHHFCDEADARELLQTFEIVKLWNDLPVGERPQRGYWIAWLRKPLTD